MNIKFDKISSLIFFIIGAIIFWESQNISDGTLNTAIGPGIFPSALGIALMVLSVTLFYETMKYKKAHGADVSSESSTNDPEVKSNRKAFFIILIAAFLYVLLLEKLGYLITTVVFLFVTFQAMDKSKWVTSLIVAVLFTGVIYFGFVNVLGGSLPGLPF